MLRGFLRMSREGKWRPKFPKFWCLWPTAAYNSVCSCLLEFYFSIFVVSCSSLSVSFLTLKISPFSLAQSIKLHIRDLDLIPCLIPSHRCRKSARESCCSYYLVTTSTRMPPTCTWIRADIWRQDGAICVKNGKIVPYHGYAPDNGS